MKRIIIILFCLLSLGIKCYGQNSGADRLRGSGLFYLGNIVPGVDQTFRDVYKQPILGTSLMVGAAGFGGYAIYKQVKIHEYKMNLDKYPSDALFYEKKISKAEKARNISLIGLGAVEIINLVTLWTGSTSPIQLAYFPDSNAIGITCAFSF